MVFSVTFVETLAILMDGFAQFIYGFLPGFYILSMVLLPILLFYKIFRRGTDVAKKAKY